MPNSTVITEDLQSLIDLSNEYICVLNNDLTFKHINKVLKKEVSVDKEVSFDSFVESSDKEDIYALIEQSLKEGKEQEFVIDFKLSGSVKRVSWKIAPANDGTLFCVGSQLNEYYDQERNRLVEALDQLSDTLEQEDHFSQSELTNIQNVLSDKIDKFKLISQNVSDIVCLHEPKEARYLYVSPSLEEVTGYKPSEFVGKSPYNFFHPDMLKMLEEDHKRKQQGEEDDQDEGPPPKMVYKILAKDGGYIWLESHSRPIFDDEGNVIMLLSTSRDVTERVDAEAEKEKFYQYYRILGNNIPNGAIFLINEEYRFLIAEGQEFKNLNRTPDFYLNKTIYEVYDKDRLEFLKPYFEGVIRDKKKVKFEYQHEGFDYIFLGTPHINEEGQTSGIFLTQNITESKRIERQLRETINELEFQKSAMDSAALVSITNPQGIITYINDRFCKITGYEKKELLGHKHSILRSGYHDLDFIEDMKKSVGKGKMWHGEIKNKRKDGNYFWVDTYVIPFKDELGNVVKHVYIRFDITDRKKAEEDLKARNFELDAFAYHTSHDLRAPLSSVVGLTKLIEMENDLEKIKGFNKLVQSSITKLDNFIKSVMTHSQNKNKEEQYARVSFKKIVDNSIEELKYHQHFDRVDIKKEINGSGEFLSDHIRLSIVLKNLIANSIKYTNTLISNSYLSINISYDEQKADITIADNGIGIKEDYLDKVFNMFFRANDRVEGSGLGLYIVKQTVERLDGTIDITSEYGKGTSIKVSIPNKK